jgi:hypothetical protein
MSLLRVRRRRSIHQLQRAQPISIGAGLRAGAMTLVSSKHRLGTAPIARQVAFHVAP